MESQRQTQKKPPEMGPALKNYWIPKLEYFRVKRLPSITEQNIIDWGEGLQSTEVAVLVLTQQPRVRFLAFQKFY